MVLLTRYLLYLDLISIGLSNMTERHLKIYHTKRHLALVMLFIIVPFIFFLLFSRFAQISIIKLLGDLASSFYRIIAAYLIAVILGWILAVSFYRGEKAIVSLPIFDVLQSFPTFAALPLVTLFWGVSNFTVIFFLVGTMIWPIFFSTISSLKLIRRDWQEATEIFDLRGLSYLRYFLIPVSLPGVITGSIVGLGEGWEAVVATEIIIGIPVGLGEFFKSFAHNPVITAFGILGFLILIFTINKLIWLQLLDWSHLKMED